MFSDFLYIVNVQVFSFTKKFSQVSWSYMAIRVECVLVLSDFRQTWILGTDFSTPPPPAAAAAAHNIKFCKIFQMGGCVVPCG